ncbi:MAG: SDR family oxidoreductase [Bacteroidetes bacterium]|nr:SDR family oxidoreductase [Bacteroidota bacterium]
MKNSNHSKYYQRSQNINNNKVVCITGGTKGIGLEITKAFLATGATVFSIYSRDESAAEKLIESLNIENRQKLILYKGSVCDKFFLKNTLFKNIKQKYGKLDILINNAGINYDGLFLQMPQKNWQKVFNVNIKGTFLTSLLAKNLLVKTENKTFIINISSISGVYGQIGQVNYATSKGAILGITRLFSQKYAALNINVNTIVPGLIKTDMTKNISEKISQKINIATKLQQIGKPLDITNAALFLASEKASYITGTSLFIDGGFY